MSGLGKGILGKKKNEDDLIVEPPDRMPDPLDPRVLEQERMARERRRQRNGRRSTILSDELRDRIGGTGTAGA